MKSEPQEFSVDDLAAQPGQTHCWQGVQRRAGAGAAVQVEEDGVEEEEVKRRGRGGGSGGRGPGGGPEGEWTCLLVCVCVLCVCFFLLFCGCIFFWSFVSLNPAKWKQNTIGTMIASQSNGKTILARSLFVVPFFSKKGTRNKWNTNQTKPIAIALLSFFRLLFVLWLVLSSSWSPPLLLCFASSSLLLASPSFFPLSSLTPHKHEHHTTNHTTL